MSPLVPTTTEELQRTGEAVRRLLRGLVGEDVASDVLQETWVRALERPPPGDHRPFGWLRTVARNLARQHGRSEGRRRERERRSARPEAVAADDRGRLRLALYRRVLDGVNALEPTLRDAVMGRYFDGLSLPDLAAREGVSRATVNRRLLCAREQLRARLSRAPDGGAEPWSPVVIGGAAHAGAKAEAPSFTWSILGGTLVVSRSLLVAVVSAALGFAGGWWLRPTDEIPQTVDGVEGTPHVLQEASADPPRLAPAAAEPRAEEEDAAPRPAHVLSPDEWLQRLNDAPDAKARVAVFQALGALEPAETVRILRAIFGRIEDRACRKELMDHFCHLGRYAVHQNVPAILALGARDEAADVQARAFEFLHAYWCEDLAASPDLFASWCRRFEDRETIDLMRENVRCFANEVRRLDGEARVRLLDRGGGLNLQRLRRDGVDVSRLVRESGLFDLLHAWWADPANPSDLRCAALRRMQGLDLGRHYVETFLLPVLEGADEGGDAVFADVLALVSANGGPWALDAVLRAFETAPDTSSWSLIASAVASIGEARAIPTLIGVIQADDAYESVYGVGYFGLYRLTGVQYDETHDAAWWRAWWEQSRDRFGPAVAALPIPRLTLRGE